MRSEWKQVRLGDLCSIKRGASPRPIDQHLSQSGMPWIKIADATRTEGKTISETREFIKLPSVGSSVRVFPGDLIVSNSATPGIPKFVGLDACIHDGWLLLRDFNGLDKDYAYWMLLNERPNLAGRGNGSIFVNLKTEILRTHSVVLPGLDEQREIAALLNAVEAKIANNRALSADLEAMARALFKSWFVDFDPVKAKMQGRDPVGVDAGTTALFPHELIESQLGSIPKGWMVKTVRDVVQTVGGATPNTKNPEYWDGGNIHWTTPKDLSNITAPVLLDTARQITQAGLSKISSGLLPAGTLLMSSRAPVGYLAVAGIPVAINQGYIAMIPGGQLPPIYMYFWAQQHMEDIKGNANGSTFMEISKKAFRPMKIRVPDAAIVRRFTDIADCLFKQIQAIQTESRDLAALRDTLLPRLISGRLRIPEAQDIVKDAVA